RASDSLQEIVQASVEGAGEASERADGVYDASRTRTMIGLALVSLAGLALGVWLARRITVPLREAVATANAVASGDLNVRAHATSKDETGQLLNALASMTHKLSEIVSTVRTAANEVSAASQQLAQGNDDLSQRTQEQA